MMQEVKTAATAVAHPNIAFIKYWGNKDKKLILPANGSISMNLDGLETSTTVQLDPSLEADVVTINGLLADERTSIRVSRHLDLIRKIAKTRVRVRVTSANSFPTGVGIASSSAAFAALTAASASAMKIPLTEKQLSAIARRGSGSACRSVPNGFAEWIPGDSDNNSFAVSIADADAWPLVDLIAVVSEEHKAISSWEGHLLAKSSIYQDVRVADTLRRLKICRKAIKERDFSALSKILEEDALLMHAVMMTSNPSLLYWRGPTIEILRMIPKWREEGLAIAFTVDAGPNVHCICLPRDRDVLEKKIRSIPGVQKVIQSRSGGGVRVVKDDQGANF